MAAPKITADTKPVLRAFDQLAASAGDLSEPSRTVLAIGLDAARAGAPVRTGELAGSIAVDVTKDGGELSASAPYAPYQEFGTRYVRGRRFMRRGADAIAGAADPEFTRWMAGAVDRATR